MGSLQYVVDFKWCYSTRMQAEKAYKAFLEYSIEKGEHVSNKWCWKDWVILV
jgi:hypothetical protein